VRRPRPVTTRRTAPSPTPTATSGPWTCWPQAPSGGKPRNGPSASGPRPTTRHWFVLLLSVKGGESMDIAMLLGSPDGMTTAARTPHSRGPVGAGGSDRARPAAEPVAGQESGGGFRARMLARVRRGGRTGAPSTGRGAGQPGTRPAGQRRPEGAATGTEAAAAAALTLLVHGGQDADAATVVPAPGAAGGGEAGSALLGPPTAAEGEAGAGVTAGLPPFAEAGEPEIQAGPAPAGPEAGAPAATPAGGTPAGEEGGPGDSAVPGASGSAVQGDAGTGPDGAGAFPDGRGAAGAGGYAGLEAAPDPAAARAAIDGRVAAVAA